MGKGLVEQTRFNGRTARGMAAGLVAWALIGLAPSLAAPARTTIEMSGTLGFPESITSTADGAVFMGSTTKNAIYRAAPGSNRAEPWIQADANNGLLSVFGVLADEATGTLWACSTDFPDTGKPTGLKAFDMKTGALRASYDFPGGGICNDMAVAANGTVYVTDMAGRILRLAPHASALEVWIKDPQLALADGIIAERGSSVVVNTLGAGKLFRIPVKADGGAGPLTPIATSRPLTQPDGMRFGPGGVLYLVEGAGRLDQVLLQDGDRAEIRTLASGYVGPAGVTTVDGAPWVLEAKSAYRMDPALKDKDPGPFRAYAAPPAAP